MITVERGYYPNHVTDPEAPNYPYGDMVKDSQEFQSWRDAIDSLYKMFKADEDAAWFETIEQKNGKNLVVLSNKRKKTIYYLKTE